MNFKRLILLLGCSLLLLNSCFSDDKDTPQVGNIVISSDASFQNLMEHLSSRYMALYPESKIQFLPQEENRAFNDLITGKVRVILMSRDLNSNEKKSYRVAVGKDPVLAKVAGDALVFVVSNKSSRQFLDTDEVKSLLTDGSKTFIMNGKNSSNFNFLIQKTKIKSKDAVVGKLETDEDIVRGIPNIPNKIGVVSLNTISNPYSDVISHLRKSVRILSIVDKEGKETRPEPEYIRNLSYPYARILYFLTNEPYFGLGNGFIRFSCFQKGQIIVKKQGLQPYHNYERKVRLREF